ALPWSSSGGSYLTDGRCWLFSLVNNQRQPFKLPTIKAQGGNAMYCHSSYGPTFGGGHDIKICDNSNTNESNSANLTNTYDLGEFVFIDSLSTLKILWSSWMQRN